MRVLCNILGHRLGLRARLGLLTCWLGVMAAGCDGRNRALPSTDWQADVYTGRAPFKGFCEKPTAFGDQKASPLYEQFFVREMLHSLYYWYQDLPDRNPAEFTSPEQAFYALIDAANQRNGYQDRFSFMLSRKEHQDVFIKGTSESYGARWHSHQREGEPLAIYVAYSEPNSPAAEAGLQRGDRILQLNGKRLSDAVDGPAQQALIELLHPKEDGTWLTLSLERPSGEAINLRMQSREVTQSPVLHRTTIATETGPVGYIALTSFLGQAVEPQLIASFAAFAEAKVSDLIVDLRYNGGGHVEQASRLAFMIAGAEQTAGRVFSQSEFNNQHPQFNPITGRRLEPEPFISRSSQQAPLPSLNLKRVGVITTGATCSASELLINSLKGIGVEVYQIGQATCGKPFAFYNIDNCDKTYFPVQLREINAQGFGQYEAGFVPSPSPQEPHQLPGCAGDDTIQFALGNPQDPLLAAALHFRTTGQCTKPASQKAQRLEPRLRLIQAPWERIATKRPPPH